MASDTSHPTAAATPVSVERLLSERSWLQRIARSLVANPHDADDLVQDTLLTGLRRGPRDVARLRPWLSAVLRNAAGRLGRASARRRDREAAIETPDPMPSTADAILRASQRRDVVDAVLRLPEPYRSALVLRFLEDRTPAEIGALEGVSVVAVRSRVHRGLEMVRRDLDARHGGRDAWRISMLTWLAPSEPPLLIPGASKLSTGVTVAASIGALVAVTATTIEALGSGSRTPPEPAASAVHRVAEPRALAASFAPVGDRVDRARLPVPLVQDPVVSATLRVVDEDGAPVSAAQVEVWPSEYEIETIDRVGDGGAGASTEMIAAILSGRVARRPLPLSVLRVAASGADGRCDIEVPSAAGHLLVTTADGRTSGRLPVLRSAGEHRVVVYRRFLIEGIVLDAHGRPRPQAQVDLSCVGSRTGPGIPLSTPRPPAPVFSGPDGGFVAFVDPFASFEAAVAFDADGFRTEHVRVWASPGGRAVLELRELGTASLIVELVDAIGDPVPGGRLRAVSAGAADDGSWRETFHGAVGVERGRYVVPLPGPGAYELHASGPDLATSPPIEFEIADGTTSTRLRVVLADPVSILGLLTSAQGVPIADAELVATVDRSRLPWDVDPFDRDLASPRRVLTDFDGSFDVVGLHPELRYELRCERGGAAAGSFTIGQGVRGQAGRQTFVAGAEHLAGALVHLEFLTPAPRPAPSAVVYDLWERRDPGWQRTRVEVELELLGRTATIEGLEAGREYALSLRADGYAALRHGPWICRRFSDAFDLTLAAPGELDVLVVDAHGVPVVDALISVQRGPALPPLELPAIRRSDAQGRASLGDLGPGPQQVRATSGDGSTDLREVLLRSGERVSVTLRIR